MFRPPSDLFLVVTDYGPAIVPALVSGYGALDPHETFAAALDALAEMEAGQPGQSRLVHLSWGRDGVSLGATDLTDSALRALAGRAKAREAA